MKNKWPIMCLIEWGIVLLSQFSIGVVFLGAKKFGCLQPRFLLLFSYAGDEVEKTNKVLCDFLFKESTNNLSR